MTRQDLDCASCGHAAESHIGIVPHPCRWPECDCTRFVWADEAKAYTDGGGAGAAEGAARSPSPEGSTPSAAQPFGVSLTDDGVAIQLDVEAERDGSRMGLNPPMSPSEAEWLAHELLKAAARLGGKPPPEKENR